MARTRGRNTHQADPIAQYERLSTDQERYVLWRYYQYLDTEGEEGWKVSEAGSVYHQRSSAWLVNSLSYSKFRHIGKRMVTLAEKLKEINHAPVPPAIPQAQIDIPATAERTSTRSPPQVPDFSTPPRKSKMSNIIRTPRTPSSSVAINRARDPLVAPDQSDYPLTYPTTMGQYRRFNYTSRQMTTQVMCRMIIHNGVTKHDIETEWVNPRVLKVQMAWPE